RAEPAVPLTLVVRGLAQRARQMTQMGDPLVDPGEDLLVGRLRGSGRRAASWRGERQAGSGVRLLALPGETHGAPGRVELLAHRTRLLEPGLGPVRGPGGPELLGHVAQHLPHPPVDAVHV